MGEIVRILAAMFAVFGFYCALGEVRALLRRRIRRKNAQNPAAKGANMRADH